MSNYTEEELAMLGGWKMTFIKVVAFLLLIVGIFGNVFIIAIKTKAFVRQSADATYKVTLAASDTMCLTASMIREIIYAFTYEDPIDNSYVACALISACEYIFQYTSAWILMALNVERCTSLTHPLTRHHDWKFALCVSVAIVWVFIISQAALFFILTMMINDEGRRRCGVDPNSAVYHSIIYPLFNFAAGCFFPTIGFIIAHVLILRAMNVHTAYFRTSGGGRWSGGDYRHQDLTVTQSTDHSQGRMDLISSGRESSAHSSSGHRSQDHVARGEVETTFKVLLVLDVSFFVLILPRDAFVIHHFMSGEGLEDFRAVNTRLNYGLLNVFAHINNVVNFYLYYCLSWTFRAEFKNLFRHNGSVVVPYRSPRYRSSDRSHQVHVAAWVEARHGADGRKSVTSAAKQPLALAQDAAQIVGGSTGSKHSKEDENKDSAEEKVETKVFTIGGQIEIDDERRASKEVAGISAETQEATAEKEDKEPHGQHVENKTEDPRAEAAS